MAALKQTKEYMIAKTIDDRYWRVMEKMDAAGTWTEEANERFERMYANFEARFGKYLKAD